MDEITLINHIIAWHESKGHIGENHEYLELAKLVEEYGELKTALKTGNYRKLIDAIGDCMVVVVGLCLNLELNPYGIIKTALTDKVKIENDLSIHMGYIAESMLKQRTQFYVENIYNFCVSLFQLSRSKNIEPIYAMSRVYEEIKGRVGKTVNGSFIKSEDRNET